MDIQKNLSEIQADINRKCQESRLINSPPTLIAVSKQQPMENILSALDAGIVHFGENRVQEAQKKWPELCKAHPHLILHLIGSLQSNKAQDAVQLFHFIHSLDRTSLIDALVKAEKKLNLRRTYFIQVNTGAEEQKSGVHPSGLDHLLSYARSSGLHIQGLMSIPPAHENPGPHFALLYDLAHRRGLCALSMGMSDDFETAIRFGATHLRIGSRLFGAREYKKEHE